MRSRPESNTQKKSRSHDKKKLNRGRCDCNCFNPNSSEIIYPLAETFSPTTALRHCGRLDLISCLTSTRMKPGV
jgi:hypothetical protein